MLERCPLDFCCCVGRPRLHYPLDSEQEEKGGEQALIPKNSGFHLEGPCKLASVDYSAGDPALRVGDDVDYLAWYPTMPE